MRVVVPLAEAVQALILENPEDDAPKLVEKLLPEYSDINKKQIKNLAQRIRKKLGVGPAVSTHATFAASEDSSGSGGGGLDRTDCFEIVEVPNKGKGVVATRDIEKGEPIVVEHPVVSFIDAERSGLQSKVRRSVSGEQLQLKEEQLSPIAKALVFELHDRYAVDGKEKTLEGIVSTNAFQGDDNQYATNLLLVISRFNCSCKANASANWRSQEKRQAVYATRRIAKGEEICISYLDTKQASTEVRRAYLEKKYGYTCMCESCVFSTPESDNNSDEIGRLEVSIDQDGTDNAPVHPLNFMARVEKLFKLYEEEGILTPTTVARLADEIVETCAMLNKPRLTTRRWAEICATNYEIAYGADHPSTLKAKAWVENCSTNAKYGRWTAEVMRVQSR
mmetsp:Transcript_72746/g.236248  ORF Transcript_72746/g.236248 Transcript_72746/m.236248 type:complete len:393 (-) Transcript_72746:501-1679(-)